MGRPATEQLNKSSIRSRRAMRGRRRYTWVACGDNTVNARTHAGTNAARALKARSGSLPNMGATRDQKQGQQTAGVRIPEAAPAPECDHALPSTCVLAPTPTPPVLAPAPVHAPAPAPASVPEQPRRARGLEDIKLGSGPESGPWRSPADATSTSGWCVHNAVA